MTEFLERLNTIIWGAPALAAILGVGLYLSVRTGFVQFTLFGRAVRHFGRMLRRPQTADNGVSPFQALCTALAATVGTGNLVGVAGAICLGGPGAVFWIWVSGLLGMCTKYCEAVLAVRYRRQKNGELVGGPMYTIEEGMGSRWRPLAVCYAAFGLIAAMGVGNATQVNAVIVSVNTVLQSYGIAHRWWIDLLIGILLAALIAFLLLGGGRRIGKAAEDLVPLAAAAYTALCLVALIIGRARILPALRSIIEGAFDPKAVTGGMFGSAFLALRTGCARGVFTNEAGMGTASIAHASARVRHPAEQGLLGMIEVFLDTIAICTLTALVILISGAPIPYGTDAGGSLTAQAFARFFGNWSGVFLAVSLCLFAVATVLGWGLYGGRCAEFLFGSRAWKWFALLQTVTVVLGAMVSSQAAWLAAEAVNGLMAIPNLICLAALSPELVQLTREYRGLDQP